MNVKKLSYNKKYELARDTETSSEILQKLANDEDWYIKQWVASNPNTPSECLRILASDENYNVKVEVASNPNTPSECLTMLTNDKIFTIREIASKNPNYLSMLERLNDESISLNNCLKVINSKDLEDENVVNTLVNRLKQYECADLFSLDNIDRIKQNPEVFISSLKGINFDNQPLKENIKKIEFGE